MSHILTEINISNFKSISSESFELTEFTPLVGYNNAGKSNILEAIKWCWTFEVGDRPSIFDIVSFLEDEVKKNLDS